MNRTRESEGKRKLTRREVASMIFPKLTPERAGQYWSKLKKGGRMNLQPYHLAKMCQITGVTADFLFGLSETPTNDVLTNQIKAFQDSIEELKKQHYKEITRLHTRILDLESEDGTSLTKLIINKNQ